MGILLNRDHFSPGMGGARDHAHTWCGGRGCLFSSQREGGLIQVHYDVCLSSLIVRMVILWVGGIIFGSLIGTWQDKYTGVLAGENVLNLFGRTGSSLRLLSIEQVMF